LVGRIQRIQKDPDIKKYYYKFAPNVVQLSVAEGKPENQTDNVSLDHFGDSHLASSQRLVVS
jgi:hypothetical protein